MLVVSFASVRPRNHRTEAISAPYHSLSADIPKCAEGGGYGGQAQAQKLLETTLLFRHSGYYLTGTICGPGNGFNYH